MVSHPFTQRLGQRYMNNISDDYLSSKIVMQLDAPFKLSNPATATKPTPHTQQKTKKH